MFCVPAHLQRLFAHWDELGDARPVVFRLVAHAGAPCPEWVKRRLIEEFPAGSTWEFYGSTEGQFTACRSEEWLERPGHRRPGPAGADDDASTRTGTLWCAVPAARAVQLLRRPGEDRRGLARDRGRTGASRSATSAGSTTDGYVYLDGRREDLIITGGVNVYPAEVEQVLGEVPGRRRRRGVRRRRRAVGPAGRARPWSGPSTTTSSRRTRVSTWRRPSGPRSTTASATLPRTPTGKVRRLDLPDLLSGGR